MRPAHPIADDILHAICIFGICCCSSSNTSFNFCITIPMALFMLNLHQINSSNLIKPRTGVGAYVQLTQTSIPVPDTTQRFHGQSDRGTAILVK